MGGIKKANSPTPPGAPSPHNAIPMMSPDREWVAAGGLVSYAHSVPDAYRRQVCRLVACSEVSNRLICRSIERAD
jgi:hypothetical protein